MVSTGKPPVPCGKARGREGLLHLVLKEQMWLWLWLCLWLWRSNHKHNHNAPFCLTVINYLTKQPYKTTFLPVFPGNKTALVVGSRHVKEQAFSCLARKQCFVTQFFLSESKMSMKTKTKEFFRPLKPLNLHQLKNTFFVQIERLLLRFALLRRSIANLVQTAKHASFIEMLIKMLTYPLPLLQHHVVLVNTLGHKAVGFGTQQKGARRNEFYYVYKGIKSETPFT